MLLAHRYDFLDNVRHLIEDRSDYLHLSSLRAKNLIERNVYCISNECHVSSMMIIALDKKWEETQSVSRLAAFLGTLKCTGASCHVG